VRDDVAPIAIGAPEVPHYGAGGHQGYYRRMATQRIEPGEFGRELWRTIETACRDDDDSAAREHLSAGFPIYYSDAGTPAGLVVKEYPGGDKELVRFDPTGEHSVQAAA
jgi:hypothetical protein